MHIEKIRPRLGQGRWYLVQRILCLILAFSLTSCTGLGAKPPAAAVEAALTAQLAQTQSLLAANLRRTDAPPLAYEVRRVKVQHQRAVNLDGKTAVEVQGTYTLKGDRLSRSQARQPRPFTLYLQRLPSDQSWVLVQPQAG